MNTKLSTVAAAAVAFNDHKIRLCYASALVYNTDRYSKPGSHCYAVRTEPDFWQRPSRFGANSKANWTEGALEYADMMG
jgi:hypothetical protein